MLRIFTPVKIQRLRPGLNPQTWVYHFYPCIVMYYSTYEGKRKKLDSQVARKDKFP